MLRPQRKKKKPNIWDSEESDDDGAGDRKGNKLSPAPSIGAPKICSPPIASISQAKTQKDLRNSPRKNNSKEGCVKSLCSEIPEIVPLKTRILPRSTELEHAHGAEMVQTETAAVNTRE